MSSLNIFSDVRVAPDVAALLRDSTAPHTLLSPSRPSGSVLDQSGPDPAFAEADIALGQPSTADILASPRIRWAHITSAGYTRYDTLEFRAAAAARGLILTNSSSVYARPCAEQLFSFMLAQSRSLPQSLAAPRTRDGSPAWDALRYSMVSLHGQSAVFLGYGSIARQLTAMLAPFEMRLAAYRRHAHGNEPVPILTTREELHAALAQAGHIINILPANADTIGFVDAALLSHARSGAVFYNIGRGVTVNQPALADALQSGRLGAAWLDVTDPEPLPEDHPLLALPNCHITPHIGGGHTREPEALIRHFLENLRRFTAGEPMLDKIM